MSSNTKDPLFHPAERVDLEDFDYGIREFPRNIQTSIIRSLLGAGVFDGFEVRVQTQSGSTIGHIDIFNGRGGDWSGRFLNAQTGTNSQRIVLGASSTEYWIEIELVYQNSDPDSRAFWDSLVDNPDPIPDGQEVNIAGVFTRKTPFWRVKQPIRSNPLGNRDTVGYAPARFSPNSSLSIPIAVIRTNGSGQIISGNADSEDFGNDIASPTITGGSTIDVLRKIGYGEPSSGPSRVRGLKSSDQRPRMWERLQPPFLSGEGEVTGDAESDYWVRDVKSAYDALATQIAQIKEGAGDSDRGDFYTGSLDLFDPNYEYVDVSGLTLSGVGSQTVDPDDLIGTTLQFLTGHWSGFYAQVMGNEATSGDVTRVYLHKHSSIPEWKNLPNNGSAIKIVQHRMVNWLKPPTPSSGNRGLNALDLEVVNARVDYHSQQTFQNLSARVNAGKYATTTFSPVDTKDPATGEPSSNSTPRSDYFESVTEIQNGFDKAALSRGGVMRFRRGTYDFSSLGGTSVFRLSNKDGFTIEGDGAGTTILDFDTGAGNFHQVFNLTNCKDVTFKDLTISGRGRIFNASGCERLKFKNCRFIGTFADLGVSTLNFGAGDGFEFEDCYMEVAGLGVDFTNFTGSRMTDCYVTGVLTGGALSAGTDLATLIDFGVMSRSYIHDNRFRGYASTTCLKATSMDRCKFHNNICELYTLSAGSSGRIDVSGNVNYSHVHNNSFSIDGFTIGSETPFSFKCSSFNNSKFESNSSENSTSFFIATQVRESHLVNNTARLLTEGTGFSVGAITDAHITDNSLRIAASTPGTGGIGIEFSNGLRSHVSRNTVSAISGVIWKGISFTGTVCEDMKIDENVLRANEEGVNIPAIEGASRLSVSRNHILGTADGTCIYIKFNGTNSQYIVVNENTLQAQGDNGLYLYINGVDVRSSEFCNNMIRDEASTIRAFYLQADNSIDKFEDCKFNNNSMNDALQIEARLENCHVDSNQVSAVDASAVYMRAEFIDSSFSHNIIQSTRDHAVRFTFYQDSQIIGNKITVFDNGTNSSLCGFFWDVYGASNLYQNQISDNNVRHATNTALTSDTPWTGADDWSNFSMAFMLYSQKDLNVAGSFAARNNITGNTSIGFDVGFFMPNAIFNMASGNRIEVPVRPQAVQAVTLGFVVSDRRLFGSSSQQGSGNLGGHIDAAWDSGLSIGAPGDLTPTGLAVPAWLGDRHPGGSFEDFENILWPYNTEVWLSVLP